MATNLSLDNCSAPDLTFQSALYATTFTIVFIPGLFANSAALWVLCRFINKKNKSVIFMINLATADLAHVLSLPLRIYYYVNHVWPFQSTLCLMCFYLKYLNMYASIAFLTCISIQRCVFLRSPFKVKDWKRRYDVGMCAIIWLLVGGSCSLFPVMRSSQLKTNSCFADLSVRKINVVSSSIMLTLGELAGFVIPFITIAFCTWKTRQFLQSTDTLAVYAKEKYRALKMVLMCATVFFICFTPYHINFALYLLVNLDIIRHCNVRSWILRFHPFTLCLASLNCCLDPILYYFTAGEFKTQVSRHGSTLLRGRLMSKESGSSMKD
ncbi:putative P2Y purinoceptor 10 [Ambystoma mexicanum]|uniref:putative P2Y purinoceptor 10 n=1 Tax=Ambystoma mexicanum TaxID=8296 RepID=UPI0037E865EC